VTDSAPDQTAVSDAAARREKVLRARYAILGAVMALLWIGHEGEPAWVHALRLLLVLATIAPLLTLTRRYHARRAASKQQHPRAALYWLIGIRAATVTIALGLGWLVGDLFAPHHNDPARLIALRLGLLAVTIPMQIRLERRRQAMGIVRPLTVRSPRIITAKFVLVLVALGAEWLIGMWTPDADLIVAAGLFGTVAWFGPKLNRSFFNPATPYDPWNRVSSAGSAASDEPAASPVSGGRPENLADSVRCTESEPLISHEPGSQ
jgi:hypothetical protein